MAVLHGPGTKGGSKMYRRYLGISAVALAGLLGLANFATAQNQNQNRREGERPQGANPAERPEGTISGERPQGANPTERREGTISGERREGERREGEVRSGGY